MARAPQLGVGRTIVESVTATRNVVRSNTNLGIVLLLAPLAAVPPAVPLREGVEAVLADTDVEDARLVYEGIRTANPGGMGRTSSQDLSEEPTLPLVDLMRLAAGRDRIAAQYAGGFRDLFGTAVPALLDWTDRGHDWETAIIGLHLTLMAELPDTLIARKCGVDVARESAERARRVLEAGWPHSSGAASALSQLDAWLRGEDHRRNPGTTADLVAATLYIALRDHAWSPRGELPAVLQDVSARVPTPERSTSDVRA
jgi:triphosphoribosyl-dephospho-CoA synthase